MFMNSNCEVYANHNSHQSSIYAYLIFRLIPRIKEHDKILDVGCGDGKSTNLLYKTLLTTNNDEFKGSVLGIDILLPMVEYSRKHYCSSKNSLAFAKIDIASEDAVGNILSTIKEGLIDHVVSSCCFQWIEDQPKALSNLLKVLNPKTGSINLIFFYRIIESLNYATDVILTNEALSPYLKKLKEYNERFLLPWRRSWMIEPDPINSYKRIMIKSGCKEDKIKIEQLDEIKYSLQPSSEEAVNYVKGFFPDVLAEIDKVGLKEEFFKQFVEYILNYNEKHYGDKLKFCTPLMFVQYSL
ncbi:unnamed protein product [Gordionus sp. m RMFG-2023]